MPLKSYVVWKSTPKRWSPEATEGHGRIYFDDGKTKNNKLWEAALNVKSKSDDSRLVFWVDRDIPATHPLIAPLASLPRGYTACPNPGPPGVDFLRGNIIKDLKSGLLLHRKTPGPDNDLLDFINPVLEQAIADKADLYLFGELYSDKTGIHDLHMNQGNSGGWAADNGVWQDGAVVVHFPGRDGGPGHWEGIFLAFAVQTAKTDAQGRPTGVSWAKFLEANGGDGGGGGKDDDDDDDKEEGDDDDGGAQKPNVSILAALVNPIGPDGKPTSGDPETVHLVNRGVQAVKLGSWVVSNGSAGGSFKLPGSAVIDGNGGRLAVAVGAGCPLSNKGGDIVLTDHLGKQVDKVSYTKQQAEREGKLLYFQQRA